MDVLKFDQRSVINVGHGANLSAATFLGEESFANIWEAFLFNWVAKYVGFPGTDILYQGSQFQRKEFKSLSLADGT